MTPAELLPVPIEEAVVWLAGLAAVAAVLAVWTGLIAPRPIRVRMRSLADRRVGETVTVRLRRGGRYLDVPVTLSRLGG